MIFVYNDTSLKLNLHSVKTKGTQGISAVELQIADSDSGMAKTITKVTDPELCEEVQNKFGNTSGRSIKYNPSKEFVMLKDKCILFNPETDSMVVSSLAENRPKDRVKNIIVLVIDRDSRFFFPITAQWKKPNIIPFGKKHTVVVMYIKSFNWSTLNRPLNI